MMWSWMALLVLISPFILVAMLAVALSLTLNYLALVVGMLEAGEEDDD